jgi:hypothetical protein
MFSCLEGTPEWLDDGEAIPEAFLAVPINLEPVDYRILTLLFQGKRVEQIAGQMGRSREEILARSERPRFKHLQGQVEKGIVERVARAGEFEPVTVARASASGAMRRIVAQSKTAIDPRVYLAANKEVLRMAGCEPPKRIEITTPDKVLDQMTPAELEHFAATREWPTRFKEDLQQFIKYEGGEVTLTQSKSVTMKAGGGAGQNGAPHTVDVKALQAPTPPADPSDPTLLEDE